MGEYERKLTAARAAADQQIAVMNESLDRLVERARGLLGEHDATDAWAILAAQACRTVECATRHQRFAVEMLAGAAMRLAQQDTSSEKP